METQITSSQIKNILIAVMATAIFIICFKSCNDTSGNEAVIANLEKENKILEKEVTIIYSKNIEVDNVKEQYKDSVKQFKKEKEYFIAKISEERAKGQKLSRQISSFKTPEFVDYYKTRYPEYISEIGTVENKITLTDSINNVIVNDFIFGDVAKAEVKLYEQALVKSEQASSAKDSINTQNEIKISNLADVILIKDKQLDNTNEVVSQQLDIIRKSNRVNTGLKIGLGAVIIYNIVKAVIPK